MITYNTYVPRQQKKRQQKQIALTLIAAINRVLLFNRARQLFHIPLTANCKNRCITDER